MRETFGYLDLALRATIQNLSPFGEVFLLVVGYFLQLPPKSKKCVHETK